MGKDSVAMRISFYDLTTVLDLMKGSISSSKRQNFNEFLKNWRQETISTNVDGSMEFSTTDSFYPAMRIFVPSLDTDARQFGMGNHKLGHLICKALGIAQMSTQIPSELLVQRLVGEIGKRFTVGADSPHPSIHQVNEYLDRLMDGEQRDQVLQELFRKCTPQELRWIFHVILSDVEMMVGIPHPTTILGWFHNRAYELLNAGSTLKEICEDLMEGEQAGGLAGLHNLLFKPLRPMLLKRLSYNKNALPKIIKSCRRPFYAETKYDGEHIIMHKSGDTYKYYTRNGNDYTRQLGKDSKTRFSRFLHPFIKESVKDCVLDCELLVWDKEMKYYLGKNRRASDGSIYDAKHLDEDFFDNENFQRAIAILDVLYLNGKPLTEETLEKRVGILQNDILSSEDKGIVHVSPKTTIAKAQEFVDFYTDAMRAGEEGVVIKGMSTTYKFGSRAEKNGWFKIKPDYGIQSMLDLAVVAVRTENNSNKVKSFLVAAREGEYESMRFRVVAGITSHLKRIDYDRIMRLLNRDDELLNGFEQPSWISGSVSLGRNVKFVPRPNIQVVEVRASGVLNNRLQFPSITSIRVDKRVEEIDSVRDVHEFEEKIRSRPVVDEDDRHEASLMLQRKRKLQLKLKENCKLAKLDSDEKTIGDALKGRKVCVLNGDQSGTPSAQDLQKILLTLGATVVANPGKDTAFVVACCENVMKTRATIKADKCHVVYGKWLLECEKQGKLVPWQPSDLMYNSKNAEFDLFGREATEAEGDEDDEMVEDVEEEADAEEEAEEQMEQEPVVADQFTSDDCDSAAKGNLFEGYTFYIHPTVDKKTAEDLKKKVEEQNGISSADLNEGVTHVICCNITENDRDQLEKWNGEDKAWTGNFVTPDWVIQSIQDEDRYLRCYQLFHLLSTS